MPTSRRPRSPLGPRSRALFTAAQKVIPGGVNSPVRAWKRVGGHPPVIAQGQGAWLTDADGKQWLDYVLSWGPLIHGHAHPTVLKAVRQAAAKGLGFGAPTVAETDLATLLCKALPSMQQVRLVSSGTEACMSALRLARAATGRDLVVKCDGGYHGHSDALLVAAGSGCATLFEHHADSAGVTAASAAQTLSVPFNDAAAVERMGTAYRGRIAAVIVEPVAGNMGLVLPRPGYLHALRQLCDAHGALLIFDEVMTGFRVAWGGWQTVCGVRPDLTCLGKVIGGGLPVAAYGGRRDLMAHLAPLGPCYQAGTLSGNPVAVAAGLATLRLAAKPGFHARHAARLTRLLTAIRAQADARGVPMHLAQAGLMWGFFFGDHAVHDFATAQSSDLDRWRRFIAVMHAERIYLAPSPFEAAFWSAAHGPREEAATLQATAKALDAAR
jgi:glutamate-1-semialdehyde 2,1-aminomutase